MLEFFNQHGREPSPETMVIAERKLGARSVGIRGDATKRQALSHLDDVGLLSEPELPDSVDELLESPEFGEDVLSGLLADDGEHADLYDVAALPKSTRKAADSVAKRKKAKDFAKFRGLFAQKHEELRTGAAVPADFDENQIRDGKFYLIKGALAFVAETHPPTEDSPLDSRGRPQGRLRIIFENGTESAMYMHSFTRRLYEEEGKVIAQSLDAATPEIDGEDIQSGYLYILRSLSKDPEISQMTDLHKIGFTTGTVDNRIRGAEKHATYLFAPVEVVASYKLYNVRPSAVEAAIHKAFSHARLDITVQDPNSLEVPPKTTRVTEWFVAPLPTINEALEELFL